MVPSSDDHGAQLQVGDLLEAVDDAAHRVVHSEADVDD